MKKSRTGPPAGKAVASPAVATVQVPLPLLDVLADARTAFFGLCLDAGQQELRTMMEQDREQLCRSMSRTRTGVPCAGAARAAKSPSGGAAFSSPGCAPGASTATSWLSRALPT